MIEPTGSNKKPKLPARYPREPVIMFLGDMNGLDRVLELLSDLEKYLSALPDTITNDEWGKWCEVPLSYLAKCLRAAYVEYERFWRHDGWKLEDDPTLSLYGQRGTLFDDKDSLWLLAHRRFPDRLYSHL